MTQTQNLFYFFISAFIFFSCTKDNDGTVKEVVPIPPADLKATAVSPTQVDLSWMDKSTNETGFKIQRKIGNQTFADIATNDKDVTIYSDIGLTAGTTYTYRVYSFNSTGNSLTYSNEVEVTTINLATLTTLAIQNITDKSANGGGSITADGGTPVTERGICWATTQNPTTVNNLISSGAGTGNFTANLTALNSSTTYYVRAYAINRAGTAYGNQLSFTTLQTPVNPITVTDASGNIYPTISIGTQVWMAENLRTTKYRDGSGIVQVFDNTQWQNGRDLKSPMMGWYNNDQGVNTTNKFGALYNWYAINPATNGNKNVCPTGWHIPTDAEWATLTNFLGGELVAGGKMKTTGTQYWKSPNAGASNSSGFSALPSGFRDLLSGEYFEAGSTCFWWSSTASGNYAAYSRFLNYNISSANSFIASQEFGYSVRCVRD
jgi:uncharacterized protein (TIGR02145 family)